MNEDKTFVASVKSVRATDGGAHLVLTVERREGEEAVRETLTLCTARLQAMPVVGEINEETLDDYRRESEIAKALAVGLRAISYSYGSVWQLKQKLRAKGFSY